MQQYLAYFAIQALNTDSGAKTKASVSDSKVVSEEEFLSQKGLI